MFKFEFVLGLTMFKGLLFRCRCIIDYLQREDIDPVSALQVVDTTIKTVKEMKQPLRSFMMKLQKQLMRWVLKCLSHVQGRITVDWMTNTKISMLWLGIND